MEARKRPVEIAEAFRAAVDDHGVDAELVFIGGPSASDDGINVAIADQVARGSVRWIQGASDAQVHDLVHEGTAFLSIGVEGYGIPVLEAIRLGTPVLYDGVQPAADLMQGHGAKRIEGMSSAGLTDSFRAWAATQALDGLRGEIEPQAVPTWTEFARQVAEAVRSA
jgi:glycosyltransferase involved in cell wall biosynthesis